MPLLWLSLAFLAGIILADNIPLPTTTWLILAGGAFGLAIIQIWVKRSNVTMLERFKFPHFLAPPLPLPVIFIILLLGAARYQATLPDSSDPHFIAAHNDLDRQMIVTGVINTLPDERDTYTNLRIAAETIQPRFEDDTPPQSISGDLQVRISNEQNYHYGDRVAATGYLTTPPEHEAFSYRTYLARQGVYSYMSRGKIELLASDQGNWFFTPIFKLKTVALTRVYQLWPDPEASLFAGILLGVETGIPKPVQQAFKETGTTHIIAISG